MSPRVLNLKSALTLVCLGLTLACSPKGSAAPNTIDPALEKYVLPRLPEDVQNKTYVDFGGKVQLLGYNVSPSDVAPPGSSVSLVLYWQRTGSLDENWNLFTHILDENGQQLAQRDGSGPLRAANAAGAQALGPSAWELGKVYVDELAFEIPRTLHSGDQELPLTTEVVTLAVGVWKGAARLDVLGGKSDAHQRCLLTHLKTGLKHEPLPPTEEAAKENADD